MTARFDVPSGAIARAVISSATTTSLLTAKSLTYVEKVIVCGAGGGSVNYSIDIYGPSGSAVQTLVVAQTALGANETNINEIGVWVEKDFVVRLTTDAAHTVHVTLCYGEL